VFGFWNSKNVQCFSERQLCTVKARDGMGLMEHSDVEKYIACMEEVKARTLVLSNFIDNKNASSERTFILESAGLQLRKILELIAFSSLAANRKVYCAVYKQFSKKYNVSDLIPQLQRVHPGFYPRPVVRQEPKQPGTTHHLANRPTSEFLSPNEFVAAWGHCGHLLHAANPYGKPIKYDFYEKQLPLWGRQIVALLQLHYIQLVDHPGLCLIQMKSPVDGKVHFLEAVPTGLV
jgi:hypothetical protein